MYVCIMKNDDRIVELLAEMVYKQDLMIDEFKVMNSEIKNLQKEQQLTNLAIKELRVSVMNLAEEIKVVHDHEKRIGILEKKVLK